MKGTPEDKTKTEQIEREKKEKIIEQKTIWALEADDATELGLIRLGDIEVGIAKGKTYVSMRITKNEREIYESVVYWYDDA